MNLRKYWGVLTLILCLSALFGCFAKSPPAQYYTLNPMQRQEAGQSLKAQFTVSVGPVILPDSLKRPQIAIRTNDNQVSYSEFHKWAGVLKDDIKRIIAENLGILLTQEGATVSTDELLVDPDYRVVVNINRFDGTPEDCVWLNAVWTLKNMQNQKISTVTQSLFTEKVSESGYPALVNAQSRTLAALSMEVADAIKKLRQSP